MVPPPFDIKTATAVVQPYDGSPENVDTFLDQVSLLAELMPEQEETALKFVKTRLSGKARLAITNPATLGQLTEAIKNYCSLKQSPDSLVAKLNALKIKGDMPKYLEEVEKCTNMLAQSYISQNIPSGVATKMATQNGVKAIINNIQDSETKILLKARDFENISLAIQKVNEYSQPNSTAQVYTTSRIYSRGRGNYNKNFNRTNFDNRSNYNQNQHFPRNNRNNRNNYSPRGRFSQRGRGNQQGNRVFYAENLPDQDQQFHSVQNNLNEARREPHLFRFGPGQSTQST